MNEREESKSSIGVIGAGYKVFVFHFVLLKKVLR